MRRPVGSRELRDDAGPFGVPGEDLHEFEAAFRNRAGQRFRQVPAADNDDFVQFIIHNSKCPIDKIGITFCESRFVISNLSPQTDNSELWVLALSLHPYVVAAAIAISNHGVVSSASAMVPVSAIVASTMGKGIFTLFIIVTR